MDVSTRARGLWLQWLIASALVLFLVFGPSIAAIVVTDQAGTSIKFMSAPWKGWAFTGRVIVASTHSSMATPRSALQAATTEFRRARSIQHFEPTSVEIVYAPNAHTIAFRGESSEGLRTYTLDPEAALVWRVRGTYSVSKRSSTIALMSYTSGRLLWDVRDKVGKEATFA